MENEVERMDDKRGTEERDCDGKSSVFLSERVFVHKSISIYGEKQAKKKKITVLFLLCICSCRSLRSRYSSHLSEIKASCPKKIRHKYINNADLSLILLLPNLRTPNKSPFVLHTDKNARRALPWLLEPAAERSCTEIL